MGQDRLSHLALLYIKGAYVNRVDIEKVIDDFLSKKVRLKFFFLLYQNTLAIYFESCKESELANSMEILTLHTNKNLNLNHFLCP